MTVRVHSRRRCPLVGQGRGLRQVLRKDGNTQMKDRRLLLRVASPVVGLALTLYPEASLVFDGSSSRATLDGVLLDGTTHSGYTIEVWIKPTALGGTLIKKAQTWKEWWLRLTPTGGLAFGGAWPNSYWGDTEVGSGKIVPNIWQHVCCSVSAGTATFYVDGSPMGTASVHDPIDFSVEPCGGESVAVSLGYGVNCTVADGDFFNGAMYGLRVWSRPLSATEAATISGTGVPSSTTGLVNAVMLEEGTGATVHDSLTALTGRVLGARWISDAPTYPPNSFLTRGLVAYYPFNGNAKDASGNGYDGTVHDADLTPDQFGRPDAAYSFLNPYSHIAINRFSSTTFDSDFSISVVLRFTSFLTDYPQIMESSNLFLCFSGMGPIYDTWPIEGKGYGHVQFYLDKDSAHNANSHVGRVISRSIFQTNVVYNVAVVRAGNVVSMYVNGQYESQSEPINSTVLRGDVLTIGGSNAARGNDDLSFKGMIDSVRIYSRALSAAEIHELYRYESQPCIPQCATAAARVDNGFVVEATITEGGCGYTEPPVVRITGGGGTGATATATIKDGVVTAINIVSAGSGYTGTPKIKIASPPFMPWLEMAVSKVKVTQHVLLGKNYVLESSSDLATWAQVGDQFTAEDEVIVQESDVVETGKYFRIRQVP